MVKFGTASNFLGQVGVLHIDGLEYFIKLSPEKGTQAYEFSKLLNLAEREYQFYATLAPRLVARVPECFAAIFDHPSNRSALILEYLGPTTEESPNFGASLPQAQAAIGAVAALHQQWLDRPAELRNFVWLPSADDPINDLRERLLACLPSFESRFKNIVHRGGIEEMYHLTERYDRVSSSLLEGSQTLIHGDLRVANVLFPNGEATLVDWQMASIGPGVRDIAYFIGTSLRAETAARFGRKFLSQYEGQMGMSSGELTDPFRKSVLLTMAATVCGLATFDMQPNSDQTRMQSEIVTRIFALGNSIDAASSLG